MNEDLTFSEVSENIDDLEMPESIRTPGRTWTRYPRDVEQKIESGEIEPAVESEGDIRVLRGKEALDKCGEKAFDLVKPDENRLNALHARNLNSFIFAEVNGKAELHLEYSGECVCSHVVIDARENSELRLTEETEAGDFNTSFTEIYVGENASVEYGAVEKADEFSYSRRKAIVQDHGSMDWLNSIFEGDLNRTRIETVLKGDGSETENRGVWYPTGEQHHDISLHVRHIGNSTRCEMDSRSVVDHSGRSLYEGLQKVERSAGETSSFQDQETLMLSDDGESDASPKLMIENPDVEASHAAATGSIEKEKRHYLESRGLTGEKAERLVVSGFFETLMDEIELPRTRQKIKEEVERKLRRK